MKLLNKSIFMNLFFIILIITLFSSFIISANGVWFNSDYDFRQQINISTSAGITNQNFQINLLLNSTNVGSNFSWSNNCNDIRFVNDSNNFEFSYFIESCSNSNQNASIWIKIPYNITTSINQIYMYYKTPSPISNSNGTQTFDFYDDFEGDLSKWTKHKNSANINIINGELNLSAGTTISPFGHSVIGSDATYSGFLNGIIEGNIYLGTDSISEIGFRGIFSSNSGYKTRIDARSGQGLSHLKPPYTDGSWAFLGSCTITGSAPSINTWNNFRIIVNGSSFNITTDGQTKICNDNEYNSNGEISLQNHYGVSVKYDNIRIRKYFENNININLGIEEYKYTLINNCQTLNSNTSYLLTANINNAANDCFIFNGNNILFNGNGFIVDGQNAGEAFTTNNIGFDNLKIINTYINDFSYGIYIRNSQNILVNNVSINSSENFGIRSDFSGSNLGNINVNLTNIIIENVNVDDGIYIANNTNVNIENMSLNNIGNGNNDHGIYVLSTNNLNLRNVSFSYTRDDAIRIDTNSNNITLQKIYINTTIQTGGGGIYLYNNVDNITLNDIFIIDVNETGVTAYQNITNLIITNTYIENPRIRGIYCEDNGQYGCENAIFENIFINKTQLGNGIYLDNSSNSKLNNITMINIGDNDRGFEIYRSNNLSLTNLNIKNVATDCIYLGINSNYNLFENITIDTCLLGDGIEVITDAYFNTFKNIDIKNIGAGDGIRTITNSYNNYFENITIYNTTSDGIEMSTNQSNTFMNNININLTGGRGIYLEDSAIEGAPNSTFKNINILNALTDDGFFVERADNSIFENIEITNIGNGGTNDYAFYAYLTKNSIFNNINIYNASSGFVISTNSSFNNYSNINVEKINNYYGIYILTNSTNSKFENINVKNTYNNAILLETGSKNNYLNNINVSYANGTVGTDGIILNTNSADNSILTNIISKYNTDYGIQIVGSNVYLENITSSYNGDDGLYNNNLYENVSIINGLFENNLGYGIYLGTNSLYTTLKNITVKNSGQDGILVNSLSNYSIYENIYVENSLNATYDCIAIYGSINSIFKNITTKNCNTYGIYISNSDNSNISNIYAENSLNTGIYLTGMDNVNLTNLTSKNNLLYGTYLINSNNIEISYSNFLENVGTNYRVENVNNVKTYLSKIGNISNTNWVQNSIWNITNNEFSLGNYWNNFICSDSEMYSYYSNLYQVCTYENNVLDLVNSRIDYGPLVDINYTQQISFVEPTPLNNSVECNNCLYINVTDNNSSSLQKSTHLDFDNSLQMWLNFENVSSGIVYDFTKYKNNGILRNFAHQNNTNMKRGNNVVLNGNNDYVEILNFNHTISNQISVEAWIYPKNLNCVSAQDCTIITGGSTSEFQFTTNDNLDLRFCSKLTGNHCVSVPISNLQINKWQHVVGTYNSTNCNLYINGVLLATNVCTQIALPDSLLIGQHSVGLRGFNGSIDEVKIYNRVLSSIEINSSFNSNLYPLQLNLTNLNPESYSFNACSINFVGNISCTETREVTLSNASANVTILNPLNSSKYLFGENINLSLNSSSVLTNITYYINSNSTNRFNLIDLGSNQYFVNITNLSVGKNLITISYYSGCGIEEYKNITIFIISNYSAKIEKKIKSINTDMYKIELNITNNLNHSYNLMPIEFLDSKMNSGSFNPIYNFNNFTFGSNYFGNIFGWNLNLNGNYNTQINYSITKNTPDYYLLDEFVVGLD